MSHCVGEPLIPRGAEHFRSEGGNGWHRLPDRGRDFLQAGELRRGNPRDVTTEGGTPTGERFLESCHSPSVGRSPADCSDPPEALFVLTNQVDDRLHLSRELASRFKSRLHLAQESLLLRQQPAHLLDVHRHAHHLR